MSALVDEFDLELWQKELPLEPRYNIPPTLEIPVVRLIDGSRRLNAIRWGLIPPWTKDPKKSPLLNNARAETVAEKPSFRSAFKSRRCIIPASGFFEWHPEGKVKSPFFFHHPDQRPLAFAGLWETWKDTESNADIESCTIITTEANEVMAPVHERMPVILGRNDYSPWLDPAATDINHLLAPCPADELTRYACNPIVGNVKNQGPQCIEPAAPALFD